MSLVAGQSVEMRIVSPIAGTTFTFAGTVREVHVEIDEETCSAENVYLIQWDNGETHWYGQTSRAFRNVHAV